jgi:hypothetical protein
VKFFAGSKKITQTDEERKEGGWRGRGDGMIVEAVAKRWD